MKQEDTIEKWHTLTHRGIGNWFPHGTSSCCLPNILPFSELSVTVNGWIFWYSVTFNLSLLCQCLIECKKFFPSLGSALHSPSIRLNRHTNTHTQYYLRYIIVLRASTCLPFQHQLQKTSLACQSLHWHYKRCCHFTPLFHDSQILTFIQQVN